MRPIDQETAETASFLSSVLPKPPARILEVGCGSGQVTARLIGLGYRVTAIDVSKDAVAAARAAGVDAIEADFMSFTDAPFDVVLFTRSFHHLPLPLAAEHARTLCVPGGLLIGDEFDVDAVDRPTAAWFYDARALLEAAGIAEPKHADGDLPEDPLERWRAEHHGHHFGEISGAGPMREAIARWFNIDRFESTPYLHRYFVSSLGADERAGHVYARLRQLERLRIEQGLLRPCGLRISARARRE